MDNKDSEAEIHPLKTEDVKAQENHENSVERRIVSKQSSRLSRLSRWRTAAFFISLFLCLIIVFAFSFIIPCPERPVSERTWFRNYDNAVAYQFLAIEDVNEDKVQDVIFAFKASNSSSSFNRSCLDEGLPSPCAFVAAVSGTNGRALWERPAAEEIEWMECDIKQLGEAAVPGCLVVGKPVSLTTVALRTGEVLWRQSSDFGANYTVLTPVSVIPDVDSDGVQDLIIFIATGDKVCHSENFIHSGKDGRQIGSAGSLNVDGKARYVILNLDSSSYFLFYTGTVLFVNSVCQSDYNSEIRITRQLSERSFCILKKTIIISLSLFSSGDIRYLAKIPGRSRENILVVNSEMAALINAQNLQTLWTLNTSRVVRYEPLLGYYKPDVLGIVLESEIGPNMKKSGSGAVQWDLKLNSRAKSPGPATLSTADHRSAFLIWGEYQLGTHGQLYLFHPSYTNVLLELRNSTDQIIAFNATLFERSRHACYVLLRGPQPSEEPGPVSLMKRKLKEDVSESRVIWLSQVAVDSEQYIRDRLYRMRFHSRA
uniref:Family with sequence similarity 234 member A n=1 Tax=Strix occidentalis caurina TaxID=311401 RepID=A0A8D0FXA3_STROC